jgi:subtilisin-like proprotein convertase family protein
LRYTRTLYDPNSQRGLKPELGVGTWKLSVVDYKNDVRVTRV